MGRNLPVFVGLFPLPVNSGWTAGKQSTWLNCEWTLAAIQAVEISSPNFSSKQILIKAFNSSKIKKKKTINIQQVV